MHIWPIPKIQLRPFAEVEESRSVALVTSRFAWEAVKDRLRLPVVWREEPQEANQAQWDALAADLQGNVVYAVGGGLAVDAAKYLAAQRDLPLVCLPTALSVDAFFIWASGVRQDGCVRYLETKPPDQSEHYFAYAVENAQGKGWPHGELVGPGIILMAERQGRALEACHIPLGAKSRVPEAVVAETLRALPEYVHGRGLPYGIAHELDRT